MSNSAINYHSSLEDFHRERRLAAMQEILSRFTGKEVNLLNYGDVSASLKMMGGSSLGLREIPLDAIVGSVSRYTDFTRDFLPRRDSDLERWAGVRAAFLGMAGVPPIDVYKINDVYFVRDGHHRVSVARQLKAKTIQAYVTEIQTRVPLTPDTSADDLILKSEYADFLEQSHLDQIIPGAELTVTVPGYYARIREHIQAHRYFMGINQHRDIGEEEAVRDWYDRVYSPIVKVIREQGILRDFPGRTETDMYLWVSDHKYLLQKRLGWHIRSDVAATHLAEEMSTRWVSEVRRLWRRVIGRLVPQQLADVPAPGAWIQAQDLESSCLFKDLLVPVSGEEDGWLALEQALVMARCQGTYLNGLHVIPTGADPQDPALAGVKSRFEERCREAGKTGALAVVPGEISRQVLEQVILNDLVVLHIAHPPGTQLSARLGSGLRTIIRACPRPILAVGGSKSPVDSLLLAYDGSIKGREALFLAAYFAGRWKTRLAVVTAHELGKTSRGTLDQARRYLEKRGIQAKYIYKSGPAPAAILAAAGEAASNLIVMGGYGFSPMMEMVLGSSVDQVLRESSIPVMICQ